MFGIRKFKTQNYNSPKPWFNGKIFVSDKSQLKEYRGREAAEQVKEYISTHGFSYIPIEVFEIE